MKLEQSFEVDAPMETVWATMIDVERVAPCLPGAEVTGAQDGAYEGTFTVKLGPTTASYAGRLELEEVDEAAHTVTMKANGRDKRGQGSANATIRSSMTEWEGMTRVDVETDFALTGRLARFGRGGMIEDVSNRLLRDFVACIQSKLASAPGDAAGGEVAESPAAQPVNGVRLLLSVLWERVRRLLRRLLGRSAE